MSAAATRQQAATTRPRQTSGGWFKVPKAVAENFDAFTRAELGLLLMICRRGARDPITVSDRHWQDWTGLDPKMKFHAIKGLAAKGLSVEGRGEKAKLAIDNAKLYAWLRELPREDKAHTAGRKIGVDARPGAKVAPECREKGCRALCDGATPPVGLTLVNPSPNRKLVSDSPPAGSPPSVPIPGTRQTAITPIRATQLRKPVSQLERLWPQTLAAGRKYFPLVGKAWLMQVVAAVREQHGGGILDVDVAAAVNVAWNAKNPFKYDKSLGRVIGQEIKQTSPGLFFATVPEAMNYVLECREKGVDPVTGKAPEVSVLRPDAPVGAGAARGIRATIAAAVDAVKGRGEAFAPVVADLEQLAGEVSDDSQLDQIMLAEQRLCEVESRLVDVAHETFDDSQKSDVKAYVVGAVSRWRKAQPDFKRLGSDIPLPRDFESNFFKARVLELLECPRLALVYA